MIQVVLETDEPFNMRTWKFASLPNPNCKLYAREIFALGAELGNEEISNIVGSVEIESWTRRVLFTSFAFNADGNSSKLGKTPISSGKEQGKESNGMAGPSQEPTWLKSVYSEKGGPQLERAASILPSFSYDRNDKRILESELQTSVQKEPLFDELESIVKIKHAEAKMFQARAENARSEAEGLKRIAIAKSEKIEEEYASRIGKLRLAEAEEMRKQKFEELQSLERAHREYLNMKMRMETEIKDLLLKMEATKRNLSMWLAAVQEVFL